MHLFQCWVTEQCFHVSVHQNTSSLHWPHTSQLSSNQCRGVLHTSAYVDGGAANQCPKVIHVSNVPKRHHVTTQPQTGHDRGILRADSRYAPSQWETVVLCNDVSHWLGANLKSALILHCGFLHLAGASSLVSCYAMYSSYTSTCLLSWTPVTMALTGTAVLSTVIKSATQNAVSGGELCNSSRRA